MTSCPDRHENQKENWRDFLPQHIGHNEEAHMTPSYINLVQVAHSTIAGRDRDVFELYVHVIFGYRIDTKTFRMMILAG